MPRKRFANLARSLTDRVVSPDADQRQSTIAACIELCGQHRYCVERLHELTRCASAIRDAIPAHACVTDQECQDPGFPLCVSRVTDLRTGETTPAGGTAFCASVSARS